MICPTGEAKYFLLAHWTGFSTARPSGKSVALSAVASATHACEAVGDDAAEAGNLGYGIAPGVDTPAN
jgi:hypothetical protein